MTPNILNYISKPFKGDLAYEWQVGPFVFFWYHNDWANRKFFSWRLTEHKKTNYLYWNFRIGRFMIWWDCEWKKHPSDFLFNLLWKIMDSRLVIGNELGKRYIRIAWNGPYGWEIRRHALINRVVIKANLFHIIFRY